MNGHATQLISAAARSGARHGITAWETF